MTSTVKVQSLGHRVRVELTGKNGEAAAGTREVVLEPGTPEQTFYVHSGQDIRISEIDADETVVPPAAHESPETDR